MAWKEIATFVDFDHLLPFMEHLAIFCAYNPVVWNLIVTIKQGIAELERPHTTVIQRWG